MSAAPQRTLFDILDIGRVLDRSLLHPRTIILDTSLHQSPRVFAPSSIQSPSLVLDSSLIQSPSRVVKGSLIESPSRVLDTLFIQSPSTTETSTGMKQVTNDVTEPQLIDEIKPRLREAIPGDPSSGTTGRSETNGVEKAGDKVHAATIIQHDSQNEIVTNDKEIIESSQINSQSVTELFNDGNLAVVINLANDTGNFEDTFDGPHQTLSTHSETDANRILHSTSQSEAGASVFINTRNDAVLSLPEISTNSEAGEIESKILADSNGQFNSKIVILSNHNEKLSEIVVDDNTLRQMVALINSLKLNSASQVPVDEISSSIGLSQNSQSTTDSFQNINKNQSPLKSEIDSRFRKDHTLSFPLSKTKQISTKPKSSILQETNSVFGKSLGVSQSITNESTTNQSLIEIVDEIKGDTAQEIMEGLEIEAVADNIGILEQEQSILQNKSQTDSQQSKIDQNKNNSVIEEVTEAIEDTLMSNNVKENKAVNSDSESNRDADHIQVKKESPDDHKQRQATLEKISTLKSSPNNRANVDVSKADIIEVTGHSVGAEDNKQTVTENNQQVITSNIGGKNKINEVDQIEFKVSQGKSLDSSAPALDSTDSSAPALDSTDSSATALDLTDSSAPALDLTDSSAQRHSSDSLTFSRKSSVAQVKEHNNWNPDHEAKQDWPV